MRNLKLLALLLMSLFFVIACEKEEKPPKIDDNIIAEENDTMKKFEFDKDILVLKIEEYNHNDTLVEPLETGIATTKASFYDEEKMFEMYYNNKTLPTEDTEILIVYEAYSSQEFIYSEIFALSNKEETFLIPKAKHKSVDNSKRELSGKPFNLKVEDDGTLSVSINGEAQFVPTGETSLVGDETGTYLEVKNFGLLNSKENMRYQVIEGAYVMDDSELKNQTFEEAKENFVEQLEGGN